ncbi:MAG: hypothetical protein JKY19_06875 [Alcanivoracaceae bacterium]|nr:hypothetical protein [Alcanivoracaceae bacterium]
MSIKNTIRTLAFMALTFLVACSDTEPTKQVTVNSSTNTVKAKAVTLNITSTPLNKRAYLGLIVPDKKEVAPCPFLSDTTAVATVKTAWTLNRRETSHESCYWSKNLGFSVNVTVEPLATAKPVQERTYNLENPPVLKAQHGPGNNATVLYDTVWDKEQAYAMSFEQDNKLIMIYVTGMATDAQRLTATAHEIANKLPNVLTSDTKNHLPQTNAGTFNMCSTWSQSDIEAIIGTPIQMTQGTLDCKWETGIGESLKQVRVTIYSGKSYAWDYLKELGAVDIAEVGERAMMDRKRKNKNMPGHVLLNALYNEKIITVTVTVTIADHKAVALALSKNIDNRLK